MTNPFPGFAGFASDLGTLGSWNQDTMIPQNPFNQAVLTEDDSSYQLKCHVPGVKKEDLTVELHNDGRTLMLTGKVWQALPHTHTQYPRHHQLTTHTHPHLSTSHHSTHAWRRSRRRSLPLTPATNAATTSRADSRASSSSPTTPRRTRWMSNLPKMGCLLSSCLRAGRTILRLSVFRSSRSKTLSCARELAG